MRRRRRLATIALVLLVAPATLHARAGAVATEHAFAAEAGAEVLRAGGSAVDAAIAAAAAICVVHPSSCGVGGGGFALVRTADGRTAALDYRETAPAAATPDRFLRDGAPVPERTRTGGLAVATPGEVAGWGALHERYGRLPLTDVLHPAVRVARDGFDLADVPDLRQKLERTDALLRADPGLRAVYLDRRGERIVQADLATTIERVGREGAAAVMAGPTAAAIAATVVARGGVLTTEDLAAYRPRWLTPLTGSFRGRTVVTFPPPGSGGVLLEILGLLGRERFETIDPLGGAWLHLLAGAMGQAFADRARWYGDVDVPVARLLAPARLRALRARLDPRRPTEPVVDTRADAGTANVSVVDGEGNAVAITTTINTSFGAGIMVPGTGIVLNNEMDDFALPGAANVYGLTGGDANAIAPGKRPQSSMTPTIVLDGRRPLLVAGGSGGPMIISGVAQVVLGVVAFDRDVRLAVDAARIHHQGKPPVVAAEPAVPPRTRNALAARGRKVADFHDIGAVSAVGLDRRGRPMAAGDHRKDGGEVVVE